MAGNERLEALSRGYTDTIYVRRRALRALCRAVMDVVESETAIARRCWAVKGHTKGRRFDAQWKRAAPQHYEQIRALRVSRNALAHALYRADRRGERAS